MSLLTPVDAVSASGLVVSLLVISVSLGSSPPRTSGLSDNTSFVFVAEICIQPLLNPCYFRKTKNQKIHVIIYALL